jgi:Tfp pilus assembly protein PilO
MVKNKDIEKNKYSPILPNLASEKSQKFFGTVLTLCALSFFGLFAIKPTVSTIFKLDREIKDNQVVYDQLEIKIKNLTELRTLYSNLQTDLPIIMSAITAQPDVSLLFAQIQSIAQITNITINKLQNFEVEILRNKNSIEKDYYSYTFFVAGTGSYENISNFIQTLSSMERVINIDTFTIGNKTYQNNESQAFDIKGTAFFKNNL